MNQNSFFFLAKVNQKKVLALVLAFACAFTMFAGAAFTDEADFAVDTDVVDTLVALGVINGYTDGSFQPDATVTRAEMAKMIYVVRTGRSDASAYNNDATTFTDITDHWARGYIKYCQSLGVIAGKSATVFDPDATVTTQEAAKMLLVTLGYNADKAGLVGTGWGAKTTALADENGLLEDVNCGTTQGMPRQYAAQLIYNAIFTPTVVLRDGEYTNMSILSEKNPTIGEKYMDLQSYETTLKEYNDGKAKFETLPKNVTFNDYTVDRSELVGREVRVLYKAAAASTGKATIYGIFEIGDKTYIDTIVGKLEKDGDELTVDGTNYDFASGVTWAKDYKSAQPVTVTLNEDGDIYEITPDADFNFAKVTYVGSKSITTDLKKNGTYSSTSFQLEDIDVYEGIAKDDYVVFSKNDYNNKVTLTKADVVTGKVDVVNGDDITIDGTVYTKANDGFQKDLSDLDLGNTVEIVVINGYIYSADKVDGVASADNIVYVNGMKKSTSYGSTTYTAQAVFADGTTSDIKVVEIKDETAGGKVDLTKVDDSTAAKAHAFDGLYVFDLDDDEYTLRPINYKANGEDAIEDYDATVAPSKAGEDRIGGTRVNNDAVVFAVDTDYDVHVLTGADVSAWKEVTVGSSKDVADVKSVAYGNKTNGYTYIDLAALYLTTDDVPGAAYDAVYGYVVATLGQTKEDNKTYSSFSVWTGSEVETIKVEGNATKYADIKKGSFVKVEDEEIVNLSKVADAAIGAIAGTDGKSFTVVNGNGDEYKITSDTQIIYVDTDAVEGVEGGSIVEATDHKTDGTYEKNVYYVVDPDSKDGNTYELLAVFVDVNNELVAK